MTKDRMQDLKKMTEEVISLLEANGLSVTEIKTVLKLVTVEVDFISLTRPIELNGKF